MADVKNPPHDGKDGCTCGHCIDGWLSPRMKERLEGEADYLRFISTKIIEEELKDLKPDELIPEWCIATDTALQYIPTSFEQKMTLSFYKAYTIVIEAVLLILIQDTTTASCIPTVSTVQTHLGLPTNTNAEFEAKAFFDAGGEIAFALEALVDRAYEKSPEGGEYRRKAALRREEEDFESEVVELPRCRYDLDFGLVRTRLGLSMQGKGPCWFFLTDDESSGDDEEEGEGEGEGEEGDEGTMYVGNQATNASEE